MYIVKGFVVLHHCTSLTFFIPLLCLGNQLTKWNIGDVDAVVTARRMSWLEGGIPFSMEEMVLVEERSRDLGLSNGNED